MKNFKVLSLVLLMTSQIYASDQEYTSDEEYSDGYEAGMGEELLAYDQEQEQMLDQMIEEQNYAQVSEAVEQDQQDLENAVESSAEEVQVAEPVEQELQNFEVASDAVKGSEVVSCEVQAQLENQLENQLESQCKVAQSMPTPEILQNTNQEVKKQSFIRCGTNRPRCSVGLSLPQETRVKSVRMENPRVSRRKKLNEEVQLVQQPVGFTRVKRGVGQRVRPEFGTVKITEQDVIEAPSIKFRCGMPK